ncbi:MAG TPA: hypothetical protein ENK57_01990 [Polyangiaceae bacterium]|nr:hypothetical protein [Polyangiaceae bacterium]
MASAAAQTATAQTATAQATAQTATAQTAAPLQQAEEAYANVDFEAVRDHALESLRGGGLNPSQLIRTYELLGVALSGLGDTDAARDYFVRLLGLAPDHELDQSVNPQMRDPFLEARGLWAARTERLGIEVGLNRAQSSLRVQVTDPTQQARQIRVAARLEGETDFTLAQTPVAPAINAPLPGAGEADRVEYYVELLDMHGNVMLAEGSPFDPRVVGRMRMADGDGGSGGLFEDPIFWVVVAVVVAAAGGVAAAVVVDQRSRIGVSTQITFGVD